ncbi:MAG: ComEA family DNA-binding protein [Polyangiaceae bacterium]
MRALSIAFALIVLVAIGSSARAVPQTTALAATTSAEPAAAATNPPPTSASAHPTTTAASPATSPPAAVEHAKRATVDDPVSINSATLDDLERLPGIGPKRASAILDLRTKLGRFRQIEDLMRVKGIGRATLRKLRPIVRLE